jgi:hypothetical protein
MLTLSNGSFHCRERLVKGPFRVQIALNLDEVVAHPTGSPALAREDDGSQSVSV